MEDEELKEANGTFLLISGLLAVFLGVIILIFPFLPELLYDIFPLRPKGGGNAYAIFCNGFTSFVLIGFGIIFVRMGTMTPIEDTDKN
jgi:hypothetical protein